MEKILEVRNLHIHYVTEDEIVKAVNGLNFTLNKGESLGLVGETGAGKTTTALSILQLIPNPPGEIIEGEIIYRGKDINKISESQKRKIRGNEISMIFQDPMTALNPVFSVGSQIAETIKNHQGVFNVEANRIAKDMLRVVGIEESRFYDYPHQFSGGMKQRVIIAMALACNPTLLIADEPTTALDVTIQAQVLELIEELRGKYQTSLILITHDLGVVAETCDKVAIMYAGEIVEYGPIEDLYTKTKHPYTQGLFNSIPLLGEDVKRLSPIKGLTPDPTNLPSGCSFHPRCPRVTEICKKEEPDLVGKVHTVKCHHPLNR